MHKVLILGAGKIGSLISGLLAESGDYEVHVADVNELVARSVVEAHGLPNLRAHGFDAGNKDALAAHLGKHPVAAVISSLPYYCNVGVAEAARAAGMHYFDLTEDVSVTRAVRRLAEGADTAFVPQCGLAPGFISIAANALIGHFDELRSVKLRVGALPQHPNNVLKYSLTWSTEGLRSRVSRRSRSTARSTRPSTLRAASGRSARPTGRARSRWTTRPSATRGTAARCAS